MVTFLLVSISRWNPFAIGCALPVLAGVGVWVWLLSRPPQSSTEGAAVPFMVIFAAMGSVPAAMLAGFLFGKFKT